MGYLHSFVFSCLLVKTNKYWQDGTQHFSVLQYNDAEGISSGVLRMRCCYTLCMFSHAMYEEKCVYTYSVLSVVNY